MKSAAFAAAVLMVGTIVALAHAKMTASVPKDGATVPIGLSTIELTFSKPMRLTILRLHSSGTDSDATLKAALPKTFAQAATVSVEPLPAGTYDVSWTAVSEDGHVMNGTFAFTVADAPAQ